MRELQPIAYHSDTQNEMQFEFAHEMKIQHEQNVV